MEIYSPLRVTEVCRKYWLESGESIDLKSGCDFVISATEVDKDEPEH